MIGIAALARLTEALAPTFAAGAEGWRRAREPRPPEPAAARDEYVTIATYDKLVDAHIAMGRLGAEGIEARLFDDHVAQFYALAVGGIKLRVARGDEPKARKVLETDYSAALDGADLGGRED